MGVGIKIKNLSITPCTQRFNIKDARKCLAKTRKNTPCQSPAMKNGRCRMHGGKSTGAKTKEGLKIIREANLKHGKYRKEILAEKRYFAELLREKREFESVQSSVSI